MSQEDFELIEAFLNGELEGEDFRAFEVRRDSSDFFAGLVSDLAGLRLGVERVALSQKLDVYHQGIYGKRATSPMRYWAAAAVVLLFVSVGAWLLLGQKTHGEKLFQAYYHPDPGLVTTMSGGEDYAFNRAMVDYKSGDYRSALQSFQVLLEHNGSNDTLQYFLAMSELNLGNHLEAKKLLEAIGKTPTAEFSKDAFWYLGLLELGDGNYGQAIEYLRKSGYPERLELIRDINGLDGR